MRRDRGQSILYVVLLMPTLILVFSLTVEVAQMQMQRLRLGYAVDLATVSAATEVDTRYYAQTGRLRLDHDAAVAVTRTYLDRNLAASLGASEAAMVAAAAEITVINQTPGADPYTGVRLDRPSICARIRVAYRLSLLGFVGSVAGGRLTLAAHAEIRP